MRETVSEATTAGVDVSLIDAMLELSPEERLRTNDRMLRTIEELRDAFALRQDGPHHPGE